MRSLVALILLLGTAAAGEEASLLESMRSSDWPTRQRALENLRALPPAARVELLAAALREVRDPWIFGQVADELGRLGPAASTAVADLVECLYAVDPAVRSAAVRALGRIGPTAWRAIGILRELAHEEPEFRAAVVTAMDSIGRTEQAVRDPMAEAVWRIEGMRLGRGGASIERMSDALSHEHAYVRHQALRALEAVGPEGHAVIVRLLRSDSPELRHRAILAIARRAPEDGALLGPLVEAARGTDKLVARIAFAALGRLGGAGAEAAVREVLRDLDLDQAREAILSLEKMRPGGAAPILRNWISAGRSPFFELATNLICVSIPDKEPYVGELIQALYTRAGFGAVQALLMLGPRAAPAGPFLLDQLTRPLKERHYLLEGAIKAVGAREPILEFFSAATSDAEIRAALRGDDWLRAGQAALFIGKRKDHPDEMRALLADALRHRKAFVMSRALEALQAWGRDGVPALAEALRVGNSPLREEVLRALAAIGPDSVGALEAVVPNLKDRERRWAAIGWVQAVGPAAAPAVPDLLECFEVEELRYCVSMALAHVGEAGAVIVPELIADLERPRRAESAVRVLRAFGPAAATAVPALAEMIRKQNKDIPNARQLHPVLTAIDALPEMGEAGEKALRSLLAAGNETHMLSLITERYRRNGTCTETLTRIYLDLRDSPIPIVRNHARGYLLTPRALPNLSDQQLRDMMAVTPSRAGEIAQVLMRRGGADAIVEALTNEHLPVRVAAVKMLSEEGNREAAVAAIPVLRKRVFEEPAAGLRLHRIFPLLCDVAGVDVQGILFEVVRREPKNHQVFEYGWKRLAQWSDIETLCDQVGDADPRVRSVAGRALLEIMPDPDQRVKEALIANLLDPLRRSTYVARVVNSWGLVGAAAYGKLLAESDSQSHRLARSYFKEQGAAALPVLREVLKSPSTAARVRAVSIVERCGAAGAADLARLIVEDPDAEVRQATLTALSKRGLKAAEAIAPALRDRDVKLRAKAWSFFRKYPKAMPLAVDPLIRSLVEPACRIEGIDRLTRIPEHGRTALRGIAKTSHPSLRKLAVLALAGMGEVDERGLREVLAGDDVNARLKAMEFLARLGPEAEAAVSELRPLLRLDHRDLVWAAVRTLGCMRRSAGPLLDDLLELSKSPDRNISTAVAVALTRIEHPPAVLVDLLRSGGRLVEDEVQGALRWGRASSVPELLVLAGCEDQGTARMAIGLLGSLGPDARAAIGLLERLSRDESLAAHAKKALSRIQR